MQTNTDDLRQPLTKQEESFKEILTKLFNKPKPNTISIIKYEGGGYKFIITNSLSSETETIELDDCSGRHTFYDDIYLFMVDGITNEEVKSIMKAMSYDLELKIKFEEMENVLSKEEDFKKCLIILVSKFCKPKRKFQMRIILYQNLGFEIMIPKNRFKIVASVKAGDCTGESTFWDIVNVIPENLTNDFIHSLFALLKTEYIVDQNQR